MAVVYFPPWLRKWTTMCAEPPAQQHGWDNTVGIWGGKAAKKTVLVERSGTHFAVAVVHFQWKATLHMRQMRQKVRARRLFQVTTSR